jgi:hypothetical protein
MLDAWCVADATPLKNAAVFWTGGVFYGAQMALA